MACVIGIKDIPCVSKKRYKPYLVIDANASVLVIKKCEVEINHHRPPVTLVLQYAASRG